MADSSREQLDAVIAPLVERLPVHSSLAVVVNDREVSTFGSPQSAVTESWTEVRHRVGVAGFDELVCRYDDGAFTGDPDATRQLFELSVEAIGERLRLELDMESMQFNALSMMEQASVFGEVLPQLASEVDEDATILKTLSQMTLAVSVESATYLRYHDGVLEPVLRVEAKARDVAATIPGHARLSVRADDVPVVAKLLSTSSTLIGNDDSYSVVTPEPWRALMSTEAVVAPVRYGDAGSPRTLGLIVASDTAAVSYRPDGRTLGSEEVKSVDSFACILGAVLGARVSARLASELATAHQIQQLILPSAPAEVEGYDLAGDCLPSGFVGGDYYDYIRMADGRTLLVVADVSGHNLASGMMMVEARAALRSLARNATDPVELFDSFATALYPDLSATEKFLTAVGLVLEAGSGRVEIVNAGHNDTLVRRRDGSIEPIPSGDTIIGFLANPKHERSVVELQPGDAVLLFTDGITEAVGSDDEMYGEERLHGVFASCAGRTARESLRRVFDAVDGFQSAERFDDDVTAVVLAFSGSR